MPRSTPLKKKLIEQMLAWASELAQPGYSIEHAVLILNHARETAKNEECYFPEERAQHILETAYQKGVDYQLFLANLFMSEGRMAHVQASLARAQEYQRMVGKEKEKIGEDIERIKRRYGL